MANACEISIEERRSITDNDHLLNAIETISREFSYVGLIPEVPFKHNLVTILGAIPDESLIFLILNKEYHGSRDLPERAAKTIVDVNRWTREVAASFQNVRPVLITDFVHDASEILPDDHFHRMVYFRLFSHIKGSGRGVPTA
jgi:hypothetical protein